MMQPWFHQARLGIFIHWGIYAVDGVAESWSFHRGEVTHADYFAQLDGFTASRYDPTAWAELFTAAGASYVVLTAKHHDGVALWDTAESDLNVVAKSPAKRDLIGPYCQALRQAGLKVGLYFSQLDWSHPDYPSVRHPTWSKESMANPWSFPQDGQDHPERWQKFLAFHRAQLRELMTGYGPIDLLWFDGDWERTSEQWDMKGLREFLHGLNPQVVLNSRMGGHGDYETPEQGMPIAPPHGPWEFCMTINDSWGYRQGDTNYKTVRQIVRTFAEIVGMGGNLLLDIGPKADGTIDPRQEATLRELGTWIRANDQAIHGTTAGLAPGLFYGASTISLDRKTVFLFQFDRPWDRIAVKGIRNTIRSVSVLRSGTQLTHRTMGGAPWLNIPGILWIDLPEAEFDANCTVIRIDLEDELQVYGGSGGAIQSN